MQNMLHICRDSGSPEIKPVSGSRCSVGFRPNTPQKCEDAVTSSDYLPRLALPVSVWYSALMPPAWRVTNAIGINCWRSARSRHAHRRRRTALRSTTHYDRLLLGLSGMMGEVELHHIKLHRSRTEELYNTLKIHKAIRNQAVKAARNYFFCSSALTLLRSTVSLKYSKRVHSVVTPGLARTIAISVYERGSAALVRIERI